MKIIYTPNSFGVPTNHDVLRGHERLITAHDIAKANAVRWPKKDVFKQKEQQAMGNLRDYRIAHGKMAKN